ncbi:MAG: DNA polymerase I [Acidimicrobiales bacterium]
MPGKLLLLDGNSLAYRAFHALPTDMATSSGQVTNAVFGFASMLVNLLRDQRPGAVAVAFDRPEPTFRHEMVPDYKAGRAPAPDILRQQMGLVRQLVEVLGMPMLEKVGFEADDILATLATSASAAGQEVVIVTGDRDAFQLVSDPLVKVLYNRRGVSDYVLYDEEGIRERTGVPPSKYVELAALRGDTSDNLKGVPGVGEKTAARLLSDYGDLDGVFANLASLTPKLSQSLADNEPRARSNAAAIVLRRDVELDIGPGDLSWSVADIAGERLEEAHAFFSFLELRVLWDRLSEVLGAPAAGSAPPPPGGTSAPAVAALEVSVTAPGDAAAAVAALGALAGREVALDVTFTGEPGRSAIAGIALAGAGVPDRPEVLWLDGALLEDLPVVEALAVLLGRGAGTVHAHRAKEAMRALLPLGVDITRLGIDTAVASYLIDPSGGGYELEQLARRYCDLDISRPGAPPAGQLDFSAEPADLAADGARRAAAAARLAVAAGSATRSRGLWELYENVERPLVRVLAKMELAGVKVERKEIESLIGELEAEAGSLEAEICELAGEQFNVGSTPQHRRILYEKLGLAPRRRTKTGYSTDAATLERLRGEHEIVEKLLRYREVEKLRSTYGEGLLAEIGPDGRVHASFNQTVARTGRLSSDRPNLHNIPTRTEEGRLFRRAFVAEAGMELLVADYDQIELRVIAHLAQDPGLIQAFEAGTDIHTSTAARLFSVEPQRVTTAQRSKAKMVSYGLAYGMEAYGLGQRLGIPTDEAAMILSAYFDAFPAVRDYMDRTVAEARSRGYTETLFGRRRQIPELSSSNYRLRQAGERQAMNAGIQGLAADIFKVALVRLDQRLESLGGASRIVLQVHDEVVVEVPREDLGEVARVTVEVMRGACELSVPLEAHVASGPNWAEAKG